LCPRDAGRRRSRRSRLSGARPSWFRPARALYTAAAVALFVVSWALLHQGFYERDQIVDTPIYERYGEAIVDGEVPYRDFQVEYPPAALPVFVVPAIGEADYRTRFEGLMAGLGVGLVLVVATVSPGAAMFVAGAPLLLGSVVLTRFDLWPAFLTAAAVALLVRGRFRLALGGLGLGTAAKLYPALLAPVALAHVWRTRGRREALVCGAVFGAVIAATVLPFFVLSPGGVWDSFWVQGGRPLQIESLGAAVLLAAHSFGLDLTMESSHGSQNLAGGAADALAVGTTVLQIAVVLAIWAWYARGPADRERLLRACAAAVCAFVAFGKVLSPQFLIWLIPLVPLMRGRRSVAASAVLAAALVLTQLWFPYRYWELALEFDAAASWLVLARDLALVALVGVLTAPAAAGPARSAWRDRPRRIR
jgi:hypothetical protein